jgi:hypothetical protein
MLQASIQWRARHERGEKPVKYLIASIVLLVPLTAHGQLLKCISPDGRVEYASDCPPGTKEQQTGIRSTTGGPSSSAPSTQQKSLAERDAASKKAATERQEADKKDQVKQAEADQRRRACDEARSYVAALEGGARLTRTDPKTGERAFLEDDQRAKEMANARRMMQENCR